ncbi:ABC transporter permease [Candidatus Bipolaricaulota bacterium]
MRLIDVTLKNLRRRKGRMFLLVFGLSVGVATAVALTTVTETLESDIATTLDEFGANILIVPQANDLSVSYGGITVASAAFDVGELSLADLDAIRTIKNWENISVISPKLLGAVQLQGRTILLAGVRFEDELFMKSWWRIDGDFPQTNEDVLAGSRLASELGLQGGQMLEINGNSFRVAGILSENGSQDDDILFIDLQTAQTLLNKPGAITLAEIAALCTACPIEDMVEQISGALPQARVSALREAVTLRMETTSQLSGFGMVVTAVVALIGTLVVLMTMLGAVAERKHEIGLFRALGFRQRHIAQIILSEAGFVSLIGGFVGWALGVLSAFILVPRMVADTVTLSLDPWLALIAMGGALLIGLAGAAYPAIKAAGLDPTTALRSL